MQALAGILESNDALHITNAGGSTPEAMAFAADIAEKLTAVSLGIAPKAIVEAADKGNLSDLIERAQSSTLEPEEVRISGMGASTPEAMQFVNELASELTDRITAVELGYTPEEVLAAAKQKKLQKMLFAMQNLTLTSEEIKINGVGGTSPQSLKFVNDIALKLTAVSVGCDPKLIVEAAKTPGKLEAMIEAAPPLATQDKSKLQSLEAKSPKAMKFVGELAEELTNFVFDGSKTKIKATDKNVNADALPQEPDGPGTHGKGGRGGRS